MSFEANGKINQVYGTIEINEKFRKREFILEIEDGNYTQFIKFQTTQDRCNLLDEINIGDNLTVHFNLQGKPYENKEGKTVYYNNLNAWKIETQANTANNTNYSSNNETQDFEEPPF